MPLMILQRDLPLRRNTIERRQRTTQAATSFPLPYRTNGIIGNDVSTAFDTVESGVDRRTTEQVLVTGLVAPEAGDDATIEVV